MATAADMQAPSGDRLTPARGQEVVDRGTHRRPHGGRSRLLSTPRSTTARRPVPPPRRRRDPGRDRARRLLEAHRRARREGRRLVLASITPRPTGCCAPLACTASSTRRGGRRAGHGVWRLSPPEDLPGRVTRRYRAIGMPDDSLLAAPRARPAVGHAHVRRSLQRRGQQRAVPDQPGQGPDRPVGRLRPAHPDRLRPGPSARPRRGRQGRRPDPPRRRHAGAVRRDPAGRDEHLDDDQRDGDVAAGALPGRGRGAGRRALRSRDSWPAPPRTTSSRSTSRAGRTCSRPGRRCG